MPLKLIPPGTRKGNPYYLVRGTVAGQRIEVSAETTDPAAAERFAAGVYQRLLDGRVPGPGEAVTFKRAAEFYSAFRQPAKGDQNRLDRLVAHMGAKLVTEIQQADLVEAANTLYPHAKPETKNRAVIKPGAAVLHYAAENRWCAWLRIKRFKEGPRRTRASDANTARALLKATEGKKRLLILWLFKHYSRISDALRVTWDDVDLPRREYTVLVSKRRILRRKPIDPEVWQVLANEAVKEGLLFPWRTRSGVYKWLRPLVQELGLTFTPHMARHYGGTQLNATGAGLKTIMGALDHADASSSLRYTEADIDVVRAANAKVGQLVGEPRRRGKKRGNPATKAQKA